MSDMHDHLLRLMPRRPTDFEPYGSRSRDEGGADCSCGCRWFLKLEGKLRFDWGVCANVRSPRKGLLTFEHQGCPEFEQDDDTDDDLG